MATQSKDTLKSYFNTGDRPTEQQFSDLIDSMALTVNGITPDAAGNVLINMPVRHLAIPAQDYTMLSNNNVFGPGLERFTLASNKTYKFRARYIISNPGSVSRTVSVAWELNTIVITSFEYTASLFSGASANTNTQTTTYISGTTTRNLTAATNAPFTIVDFEGVMRCTTGGRITPRLIFSPGGTNIIKAGSFFLFEELGSNEMIKIGSVG